MRNLGVEKTEKETHKAVEVEDIYRRKFVLPIMGPLNFHNSMFRKARFLHKQAAWALGSVMALPGQHRNRLAAQIP